jgi:tRNA 2-thiocytidine biosynthesis protein TtcA
MEKSKRIASFMLKSLRKASRTYRLMADGDRIAVGVSGGKDSQTLLRLLHLWQPSAPFRYDLRAVHVMLDGVTPEQTVHQNAVQDLCRTLEIPLVMRHVRLSPEEQQSLECFTCSKRRRMEIFLAAHDLGCNKVALGHHADDIAATALLNLFFQGRFESMAPRAELFQGSLTVIRPLALTEEKDIVYFARAAGFWRPSQCCPLGETSHRSEMRNMLRAVKRTAPRAQVNLYRAIERASGWVENDDHAERDDHDRYRSPAAPDRRPHRDSTRIQNRLDWARDP